MISVGLAQLGYIACPRPMVIMNQACSHISIMHGHNTDVTAWFMITIVTIGIAMGDKFIAIIPF